MTEENEISKLTGSILNSIKRDDILQNKIEKLEEEIPTIRERVNTLKNILMDWGARFEKEIEKINGKLKELEPKINLKKDAVSNVKD